MSMLDSSVKAKIVETTTIEANITIQKILDMVCKHWEKCMDNYYIMDSEPELSTDDNYNGDSVTVNLSCSDKVNLDHIVDDVRMLFEEELAELIRKEDAKRLADMKVFPDKNIIEEGEGGTL